MKFQLREQGWCIGSRLIPAGTIINTNSNDDLANLCRGQIPPLNAIALDQEASDVMFGFYGREWWRYIQCGEGVNAEVVMSFYEYDDCFVWQCDNCQRQVQFPPEHFWQCIAELKSRGWTFSRNDDGGWMHYCSSRDCQKIAVEILRKKAVEILEMPMGRKRTS
jgi:hypothetical protein